jgi:hypothetical protein
MKRTNKTFYAKANETFRSTEGFRIVLLKRNASKFDEYDDNLKRSMIAK